jgi:Kelch motif/Galactose oxidase, central domain
MSSSFRRTAVASITAVLALVALAGTAQASGTGSWKLVAQMHTARADFGVATGKNGLIYAIGGQDTVNLLSSVEAFNPTTNVWGVVAPLPSARRFSCGATDGTGNVYAIGGSVFGGSPVKDVLAYSVSTNTWVARAPLPAPIEIPACIRGANGDIYVFDTQLTPHVYRYNPTTNVWVTMASAIRGPKPRWLTTAVLGRGGNIYLVGGMDNNGAVFETDIYHPASDTWTTGTPLPTSVRFVTSAVGWNGRIYAGVGGADPMVAYSFSTRKWTTISSPPNVQTEGQFGASGHLYYFGSLLGGNSVQPTATFRFAP